MLTYLDRAGAWFARKFGARINTSAAMLMAVYTTIWGFWLINPWWSVFNQADLFWWLNSVAPEWFWGAFAMTTGISMGIGIMRHTFKALTRGAFLGFIHWGIITYGYFLGDWRNTGGVTTAMISIYCAFIYINLMVNRHNPQEPRPILE